MPESEVTEAEVEDWFDSEEESEEEVTAGLGDTAIREKYSRSQLRVVRETKDYTLDYLKHALSPGRELIDISPSYQRRLRWSRKKQSALIESFLLNIPIPAVFLYEREYNEYEVIDGRQRLQAVHEFLENNFELTGLEYWSEFNRKRFNDVPSIIQKGLLRRSLPAVVLLAETLSPSDDEIDVRRVLFDRLNTGGEKLNPQELRNALYPGPLNDMLIKAARTVEFTRVWDIPPYTPGEEQELPTELERNPLFKTMMDCELVLRFFAIRDAVANDRRGSLRRILDRYMKEASKQVDLAQATQMKVELQSVLHRLHGVFGGDLFRIPSSRRPSRPLYDALTVGLSLEDGLELGDGEDIRQRLREAVDKPDTYDILVGRGNTIKAVTERVRLARSILHG